MLFLIIIVANFTLTLAQDNQVYRSNKSIPLEKRGTTGGTRNPASDSDSPEYQRRQSRSSYQNPKRIQSDNNTVTYQTPEQQDLIVGTKEEAEEEIKEAAEQHKPYRYPHGNYYYYYGSNIPRHLYWPGYYPRYRVIYDGRLGYSIGGLYPRDDYGDYYDFYQTFYSTTHTASTTTYRTVLHPPLVYRSDYYRAGNPLYFGFHDRYPFAYDPHPSNDDRITAPVNSYYKNKIEMKTD